jgi:biotin operon repressor
MRTGKLLKYDFKNVVMIHGKSPYRDSVYAAILELLKTAPPMTPAAYIAENLGCTRFGLSRIVGRMRNAGYDMSMYDSATANMRATRVMPRTAKRIEYDEVYKIVQSVASECAKGELISDIAAALQCSEAVACYRISHLRKHGYDMAAYDAARHNCRRRGR